MISSVSPYDTADVTDLSARIVSLSPSETRRPPIRVRRAGVEDAYLIAAMAAGDFWERYRGHTDAATLMAFAEAAFTVEATRRVLRDPSSHLLLAEREDQVQGFLRLTPTPAPPVVAGTDPVEISALWVGRIFRRTGVATALLRAAIDIAVFEGRDPLWLRLGPRPASAKAFLTRRGFEARRSELRPAADHQRLRHGDGLRRRYHDLSPSVRAQRPRTNHDHSCRRARASATNARRGGDILPKAPVIAHSVPSPIDRSLVIA